jgi:UDP-N-acetylglucosamine acyltransferase
MIDPTARVSKKAELGEGVTVGPFTVIGDRAKVGDRTSIGSSCSIDWADIGEDNQIFQGVIIGNPPQDVKYDGRDSWCRIGDKNIIREYVTVHRGSGPEGDTHIGSNNYLMAYAHVAHNCRVGNRVIIANAANLAGYVMVEDGAVISGLVAVHQFVRIGAYSIVGGGLRVSKDVVPYALAAGYPVRICGLNVVGLRRNKFTPDARQKLKTTFRYLFRSNLNTNQALDRIKKELPSTPEIDHLVEFVETSERGITK